MPYNSFKEEKMLQAAQGSFPGLRHYALHHCGIASTLNNLSTKAKGKCYKPSFAVEAVFCRIQCLLWHSAIASPLLSIFIGFALLSF